MNQPKTTEIPHAKSACVEDTQAGSNRSTAARWKRRLRRFLSVFRKNKRHGTAVILTHHEHRRAQQQSAKATDLQPAHPLQPPEPEGKGKTASAIWLAEQEYVLPLFWFWP
jgi:hypothetical protein